MTVRHPRSKFVSALEKRLGRNLSDLEMLRLASCARALRVRRAQQQQRVYKPRMELWDDGDSPLVTAVFEVPGLRPADVAVDVVDGRLVVSGERRQPEQGFSAAPKTSPPGNENGSGTHRCSEPTGAPDTVCVRASEETLAHAGTVTVLQVRELKYGFFRRVIAVPAGCTTAHLQATMENGMLTVSWPRDPGSRISDMLLAEKTQSALQLDTGVGAGRTENACV